MALAFEVPDNLHQGMFVYGTVQDGETVYFRGIEAPVQDGVFMVALGRNAPREVDFVIDRGWFSCDEVVTVPVAPYPWHKEYVNGVPQKTVTPSKEHKKRLAEEQKILDNARAKRPLDGFPMCFEWPIKGRITGEFGAQRVYNGTPLRPHSGLDIAAPKGTPIKASADGIVILSHPDLFYTGGTVLMEHGSGVQTGYSHLSRLFVQTGDRVKKGDVIGEVGSTGRSTGPHLHFTLAWENIRVNPLVTLQDNCP